MTSFSPKRLSKQSKSQTFALWLREPNSYPLYNFIIIPYSKTSARFSIDPKKYFNPFRVLLKMTLNALTFRKLYEKPSLTLSTFKVKKTWQAQTFSDSFLAFLRITLFALLPPVQEIIFFFVPVPAVKLPLLPAL